MKTAERGLQGELTAKDWLIREGYQVLESNFRTKCGEIDLIVQKAGRFHFLEVKTWKSPGVSGLEHVFGSRKQSKMFQAALAYLKTRTAGLLQKNFQFGILMVDLESGGVKYIPFELNDRIRKRW
jgi:putative endonuclease